MYPNIAAFVALQLAAAAYALWRGGAPERVAAGMQVGAAFFTAIGYASSATRFAQIEWAAFSIDTVLFAGLYALALRSNRIWPLGMAACQLAAIFVNLARAADFGMSALGYAFLLKVWGYPMVLILAVAVVRHRRRLSQSGVDKAWSW